MRASVLRLKCNGVTYDIPKSGQRPVIGICLDGTGPAHLVSPSMCHFWKGSYREAQSMMPSLTNPNNVSIVTGLRPEHHGVVANTVLKSRNEHKEKLGEIALTDAHHVKCPSILSIASRRGLPVLVVTAKKKLRNLLGAGLAVNSVVVAVEELGQEDSESYRTRQHHRLLSARDQCGAVPHIYTPEASVYCLQLAASILSLKQETCFAPSLVYISTTDYVQHLYAPDSETSRQFYERIDVQLGELCKMGRVGVTADHGMNEKTQLHFLADILSDIGITSRIGLAIKDPHMIHHLGFGSYVTVHCEEKYQSEIIRLLLSLPGVEQCRALRTDTLEVFGDAKTAFGSTVDFHRQQGKGRPKDLPIRTHGGHAESTVPFALLFDLAPKFLCQLLNADVVYNKDLFFYLCNAAAPRKTFRCAVS